MLSDMFFAYIVLIMLFTYVLYEGMWGKLKGTKVFDEGDHRTSSQLNVFFSR
jgi:hypothetical protein